MRSLFEMHQKMNVSFSCSLQLLAGSPLASDLLQSAELEVERGQWRACATRLEEEVRCERRACQELQRALEERSALLRSVECRAKAVETEAQERMRAQEVVAQAE